MNYFAGIDVGSTSIKIAITDEANQLIAAHTVPTGSFFHKNATAAFRHLCQTKDIATDDVVYVVATGYGRKLYKDAHETISEITANAMGAHKLGQPAEVRTIINIGGQDLKVIALDEEGHINNFTMNDKCAAGTGRFLEMTARNLEMEVDELGACHASYGGIPAIINSTCTVFAESEIISLLAKGGDQGEIVAGIHYSIARRVARLAKRIGIKDTIFFDGGPAMNQGLVQALETELMMAITVPENPQTTTAYGAALIAAEAYVSQEKGTNAA